MSAFTRLYNALAEGIGKRHEYTWDEVYEHAVSVDDHLRHAEIHINLALSGDTNEDHVGHALGRLMLAAELQDTTPRVSGMTLLRCRRANTAAQTYRCGVFVSSVDRNEHEAFYHPSAGHAPGEPCQ